MTPPRPTRPAHFPRGVPPPPAPPGRAFPPAPRPAPPPARPAPQTPRAATPVAPGGPAPTPAQDRFLKLAVGRPVAIQLLSGARLTARLVSFDRYNLVVEVLAPTHGDDQEARDRDGGGPPDLAVAPGTCLLLPKHAVCWVACPGYVTAATLLAPPGPAAAPGGDGDPSTAGDGS